MDITFFATPAEFRAWLETHYDTATDLVLGFYKKDSAKKGITYAEALDEALCYGWIDGIRRRNDDDSFTVRFTPRKPRSIWSDVNVNHVARLSAEGRMLPAGLKTFEERKAERSGIYSFEQDQTSLVLNEAQEERFKANAAAWTFFQKQAPTYQKAAIWWIISAKREDTREKHLQSLIEVSEKGERLKQFRPDPQPKKGKMGEA